MLMSQRPFKIIGIEHVGIAVESLEGLSTIFSDALGLNILGSEEIQDQQVITDIYDTGSGKLEFLKSTDENSSIAQFIDKKGKGIPGLIAVHQDFSENSFKLALSYSKGIGLTRMGVFGSTFKEETETDLFGEQVVLTGGIPKLIQSSYKVLLEEGYSPVTSWLVCYYELKTIVDMFHSKGFEFMSGAISDTAEYGGITRGKRIIRCLRVLIRMPSLFAV